MESLKETLIIGISGCSCSGKTTISKIINKILPNSVVIHQDSYYKLDRDIPIDKETGYDNWDTPDAIDMPEFFNAIKEAINKPEQNEKTPEENETDIQLINEIITNNKIKINTITNKYKKFVIVEGFLYFQENKFMDLIDIGFLIWAEFPTLLERRNAREGYETKEGFWKDPPNYFEKIVWPSFLNYYSKFIATDKNTKKYIVEYEPFGLNLITTDKPTTIIESVSTLISNLK